MNFRPLGDVACDDDAFDGSFSAFGLFCELTALKLSSLTPYLGKLTLSKSAFVWESIMDNQLVVLDITFNAASLVFFGTRCGRLINYRLRTARELPQRK